MAKQTLVFLLLCFVCIVMGREKGARLKDPCTVGMDALEVYIETRSCGGSDDPFRQFKSRLRSMRRGKVTLESFRDLLIFYCGTVKPYITQCFLHNIRNCPASQREFLSQVANQTGFVCQPNSDQVHPYFRNLVLRLTEEDLVRSRGCNEVDSFTLDENCIDEALSSIGYSPDEQYYDELKTLTIQELVPKVQRYMRTTIECFTRHFRENRNRCPNWRVRVLMRLRYNIFPTYLGNSMTFTREEMLQMFEPAAAAL